MVVIGPCSVGGDAQSTRSRAHRFATPEERL
jgi:3-deoxy-D-arabino-heptulosonate 7-phosphate (DAHP) synthase